MSSQLEQKSAFLSFVGEQNVCEGEWAQHMC